METTPRQVNGGSSTMRPSGKDWGLPESAIALRSEWGISEPELHVIPIEIRKNTNRAIRDGIFPKPNFPLSSWDALYFAARHCGGTHWIDHPGRIRLPDGRWALASEPYQFFDYHREQIETFCRTLGLTYEFSERSWWYPGRTVRLTVAENLSR